MAHQDALTRYEAMQTKLIALAEAGQLFLTDIQTIVHGGVRELATMVALGKRFDENRIKDVQVFPHQLEEYRVKLRPLNGRKTIDYVVMRDFRKRAGSTGHLVSSRPKLIQLPVGEDGCARVSISTAWTILCQCGKDVLTAKNDRAQATHWWCEEVKPDGYDPHYSGRPKTQQEKNLERLAELPPAQLEKLLKGTK